MTDGSHMDLESNNNSGLKLIETKNTDVKDKTQKKF